MLATLLALSAASLLEPLPGPPTADTSRWKPWETQPPPPPPTDPFERPHLPHAAETFRDITDFERQSPFAAEIIIRRDGDLGSSFLRCIHQAGPGFGIVTILDESGRPRERWLCPPTNETVQHADLDRGLLFNCPEDQRDRFLARQILGVNVIPYMGQVPVWGPTTYPLADEIISGVLHAGYINVDGDTGWPTTERPLFPNHYITGNSYVVQAPASGEFGRCANKFEVVESTALVRLPRKPNRGRSAERTFEVPASAKRFHELVTYDIRHTLRELPAVMADGTAISNIPKPPRKHPDYPDSFYIDTVDPATVRLTADPGKPPLKPASTTDKPSWDAPTTLPDFRLSKSAGDVFSADQITRPTLLVFWTHWSSANPELFRELAEIKKALPTLDIIPVSIWANDPDLAKTTLAKHNIPEHTLLQGEELARACRISIAPTLVLVGPNRAILHTASWRDRVSTKPIIPELTKELTKLSAPQ